MVMTMKSLIAHSRLMESNKILLRVCVVCAVLLMGHPVFAAESTVSKSAAPGPVLILSNANIDPSIGFSRFNISHSDIPRDASLKPKELLEIRWNTTYYPQTLNDSVELCYYRPFSSTRSCETIFPNSSGVILRFNDQPFGPGSIIDIRHSVLGGSPPYARPAGVDSIILKYRY